MLPKNRRIERKDFSYIISHSKKFYSPHFSLFVSPLNKEKINISRFSFSISKKIAKTSVERNKWRRRGYSIISRNIKRFKNGFFLFFSFKNNKNITDFNELEREILNLLHTSGMIL